MDETKVWTDGNRKKASVDFQEASIKHSPNSKICVGFYGNDFFGPMLGSQLSEVFIRTVMIPRMPGNFLKYLSWYFSFGARMSDYSVLHVFSPTSQIKMLRIARRAGIPVLCHWIGSDVLKLNTLRRKKQFFSSCPKQVIHVAVASHLSDELAVHFIQVKSIVPIMPPSLVPQEEPLPLKPAVLGYWTEKRAKFMNSEQFLRLAGLFPNVPFYVLGAEKQENSPPPNVIFLGFRRDVKEWIRNVTCYIRLVPHDGESTLLAECLAMGRYVLYNHPKPACEFVDSFENLPAILSDVLGRAHPNCAGVDYVRETCQAEFGWF